MIYFDNAATTRPERAVAELAAQYLDEQFYNPSALYAEGYNLHRELEEARRELVSFVADPDEFAIVMTSCGTEADNQAIFCGGRRGNIVTTMGEHAAVYAAAQEAGRRGTEASFAPLNPDGSADADALLELVDDKDFARLRYTCQQRDGRNKRHKRHSRKGKGQKSARPLSFRRRAGIRQAAVQAWQEM